MRDKYGTGQDPYTYPNTETLRNKFGIQDPQELSYVESQLSTLALGDIDFTPPPYDFSYLCSLHRQLFSDIYEWAGQPRTIAISKDETRFCQPEFITREASKLFQQLKQKHHFCEYDPDLEVADVSFELLCSEMAEFYIELNMIHPFREGNGRAQRLLFEHLAINCGYNLNFKRFSKTEWVNANILGCLHCDYSAMTQIFSQSLTPIADL